MGEMLRSQGQRILTAAVFGFFTVASNDFAIGFPVIVALYGEDSNTTIYIAANALISAIFFQPLTMTLLEVGKSIKAREEASSDSTDIHGRVEYCSIMKAIFVNPVIAV